MREQKGRGSEMEMEKGHMVQEGLERVGRNKGEGERATGNVCDRQSESRHRRQPSDVRSEGGTLRRG
ncbi:hypothetical protein Syun_025268 [Stephania yunnanensis]|uniref:Uncharacterized protein n=1 Tax=Stephania yunnanensis TaxID=152371 RepID=A0AAP0EWX7_9MAGN